MPNSSLLPCCNHSILQYKPNNILINELQNPLAKKTFTVCSPQEAIVRIRLREQNDVTEPLVLSFSGATDWLKGWRETCRLITERNKAKQISIQNEATHPGLFSVARAKIDVHGTKENIEKDVFSSSHERGTKKFWVPLRNRTPDLRLSGRASERGIRRSEVRFLAGGVFSLSHARDDEKRLFLFLYRAQKLPIFLILVRKENIASNKLPACI